MTVSPTTVSALAPIIHFHANEVFYPCSIEHILQNGTIKSQSPIPIYLQNTSQPACAVFKELLWMVYSDANSSQLWVTSSVDGLEWDEATKIENQFTSVPALAVFNNKLWMAYTDEHSSEIWVTSTSDGRNWAEPHQIGQETSIPALVAFKGKLWMIYTDSDGSAIYVTSSSDGDNWGNTHTIGQNTSVPAVTVQTLNGVDTKLVMAYSDADNSDIWVTSSTDGDNWGNTHKIGQNTSVPALSTFLGKFWMVYSDADNSDVWVTSSSDGDNWGNTHKIGLNTSIPALTTFGNIMVLTYTGAHSSQLYAATSYDGDNWTRPDIPNPTQADMLTHATNGSYIEIAESQYSGEGLTAPMYYAVQEFANYAEITYLLLFAYNGHQTINASNIKCILDNYARHPGDIERVTIRFINTEGGPVVTDIYCEAHGDVAHFPASNVSFENNHALINSSLNAHGTFNRKTQTDWIVSEQIPLIVEFGDAVGIYGSPTPTPSDQVWRPSDYRLVGLDTNGDPIGDQVWAAFAGRIGQHVDNSFSGARYFDGSGLSGNDWAYIKTLQTIAGWANKIPPQELEGVGPKGLAGRPYISPAS